MRILITGNMGYVGSVVAGHLRARYPDASLIGFDSGYFEDCLTGTDVSPEVLLDRQIFGDVRETPADLFNGVDAVIHLAAISNDPMGTRFEAVTDEINYRATTALAEAAWSAGVRNFVFASSCSVYGAADGLARRETDNVGPLTAYGRSKIAVERYFEERNFGTMTVTCLRFATACGMSPRLRLDLVLNDFVACALASRKITVLSDGMPWRPLIDVGDMARAIEWAAVRTPGNGGPVLSVNAGCDEQNFRVKELAQAVAEEIPGTDVDINMQSPPDRRSYRVDFSLFRELAPEFVPVVTLRQSIASLREGLAGMGFADAQFRNSQHMRLNALEAHIAADKLTPDLRWRVSYH
ncbi:MAG TPA: SDR family oxidoreductase [Rhizomicrobium sp.]|jgi:nucleoside-diphosphate-sugar epimerase|nr:SDR family oxidoreductase [Rhizomicrobium sp.]